MELTQDKIKLGQFCKNFRLSILKMTLKDFSISNQDIPANISAFESGRANNIKYLGYYYSQCKTHQQQQTFKMGVFK